MAAGEIECSRTASSVDLEDASPAGRGSLKAASCEIAPWFRQFSRFNRDDATWIALSDSLLWDLARERLKELPAGSRTLQCWSCGCSSGEEAYYLSMIWRRRLSSIFPELSLAVIGTDVCTAKIEAAKRAVYPQHSVQGLPLEWQKEFFEVPEQRLPWSASTGYAHRDFYANARDPDYFNRKLEEESWRKLQRERAKAAVAALSASVSSSLTKVAALASSEGNVVSSGGALDPKWLWQLTDATVLKSCTFFRQDATEEMPEGPFDVILSRYAVCLYLEGDLKVDVLGKMVERLRPGGFFVIGAKDQLPLGFCNKHGLTHVVYRTTTDACPFGPKQLVSGLFRKASLPKPPGEDARESAVQPRMTCATLTHFLQSTARRDPDWIADRERACRERTRHTLTNNSLHWLEKAASEGRSGSMDDLLERMDRDCAARRERWKETLPDLSPTNRIVGKEAVKRIEGFMSRLDRDLAHREEAIREAAKVKEALEMGLLRTSPGLSGSRSASQLRTSGLAAGAGLAAVRRRSSPVASPCSLSRSSSTSSTTKKKRKKKKKQKQLLEEQLLEQEAFATI